MKVALHPDASPTIGTGHVMRCHTLGQALQARGAALVAEGGKADWLVVDHYGLDARWEKRQRRRVARILAIDDLADRAHDCDLLLDQNFFPDAARRYDGLVPDGCRRLLGPRYALLRPEFLRERRKLRKRTGKVKRVLVTFGGLDAGNMTSRAIALLKPLGLEVDVVAGGANPHAAGLARECAAAGFRFHRRVKNMAKLMGAADFAVGAGGSTTWERCCLGLPTLQVAIAPNQEALSQALAKAGVVFYAGKSLTAKALRRALASAAVLKRQADRMRELVDGQGAQRVAAALYASRATRLALRKARKTDIRLYFDWANDPEVRRQSMRREPVQWVGHRAWFERRLADSVLLVAEDEAGMPAGQVRFEPAGGAWRISYSLAAEFRGFGLGGKMLGMAIDDLRRRHPRARLEALVKADNEASRKVFVTLGFARKSDTLFERDA